MSEETFFTRRVMELTYYKFKQLETVCWVGTKSEMVDQQKASANLRLSPSQAPVVCEKTFNFIFFLFSQWKISTLFFLTFNCGIVEIKMGNGIIF